MFTKGQKVVCVDGSFTPEAALFFTRLPEKDKVYTIRGVYLGRRNAMNVPGVPAERDVEVGVLLEELRNPRDPRLKAGLEGEPGFNAERFAPLATLPPETEEKSDEGPRDGESWEQYETRKYGVRKEVPVELS